MTVHLVRNHSHWGAFFAEVEDGRVVGVRPFEHDPDPSHLINAIPGGGAFARRASRSRWCARAGSSTAAAHGEGRGREPFVPVSWDKALDLVAGEIERVRREHGNAGDHGRLAGLVVGRHFPRGARCSCTASSRPAAASSIR